MADEASSSAEKRLGVTNQNAADTVALALATGTAPAINIVLGTEAIKPFAWFAGAMLGGILLLVILLGVGVAYSISKTEAYRDDAITKTQEERITQSKIEELRNEIAEYKGREERQKP